VRDRVNEVAAEVVRLTAALEGPASPIATMIANGGSHGKSGSGAGSAEETSTLADRICALKSSVSRQV
jgi:hypothetical protein